MAQPIKFYYDLLSPPSRALLTIFKMTKIPFEDKAVALRKREHMTEEYRKDVSKFQKVPVIHDGDFRLSESPAILRYVIDKYQVKHPVYPDDLQAQARIEEYLSWAHNNIRLHVGMSFFTKFRDPLLFGTKPEPKKIQALDRNVQKVLDEMENLWTETPYIAGDKLTVADIFASCDLEQSRMTGIDPLENRPKIADWFNRTKNQLEPLFTEHHKYVYVIADIVKKQESAK